MENYLPFFALPIVVMLIVKVIFSATISWREAALQVFTPILISSVLIYSSVAGQSSDVEIWNGEVVSKARVHDYWLESYDCNCVTTCSGTSPNESCTEVCETCYTDHYTADWNVQSNIGTNFKVGSVDYEYESSRDNAPDPAAFLEAYKGMPCSVEHSYDNWLKAVPDSLFTDHRGSDVTYAAHMPAYPKVYSYWHVNRLLMVNGASVPNAKDIEAQLDEWNKTLGVAKQANVIMVVVKDFPATYRYSLERAWKGAKKNDVILLVGTDDNKTITWTDVVTFGHNMGNELMTKDMIGSLLDYGKFDTGLIDVAGKIVATRFDREPMANFQYLQELIKPSDSAWNWAMGLSIFFTLLLTFLNHSFDMFDSRTYSLAAWHMENFFNKLRGRRTLTRKPDIT
jgi:hypothetical protein